MKTVFGFLVGAILLTMPIQAVAQELTPAEIVQIKAEIEKVAESMMDMWAMNDCDAAVPFWHPDFIFQPLGGVIAKTVDDVKQQCDQALANRASFSGGWINTEIRVLSRNAAVLAGNWEGTFHYRDDTAPRHYAHSATVYLLVRMEDGWGISFYVNSNDPPQAVGGEG